jgi:hypothetical protein
MTNGKQTRSSKKWAAIRTMMFRVVKFGFVADSRSLSSFTLTLAHFSTHIRKEKRSHICGEMALAGVHAMINIIYMLVVGDGCGKGSSSSSSSCGPFKCEQDRIDPHLVKSIHTRNHPTRTSYALIGATAITEHREGHQLARTGWRGNSTVALRCITIRTGRGLDGSDWWWSRMDIALHCNKDSAQQQNGSLLT